MVVSIKDGWGFPDRHRRWHEKCYFSRETLCGIGGTPLSILTARDARPAQVGRLLIKGAFMDLDALRTAGVDVIETPVHLNAYRRDLWPEDTLAMLTRGERPLRSRSPPDPPGPRRCGDCLGR